MNIPMVGMMKLEVGSSLGGVRLESISKSASRLLIMRTRQGWTLCGDGGELLSQAVSRLIATL
jgi:hypothetical protein